MEEIKSIALSYGMAFEDMGQVELVRAIQSAEGNEQCFGTGIHLACGQSGCSWRQRCSQSGPKQIDTFNPREEIQNSTNPSPLPSDYSLQGAVELAFKYLMTNDLLGARAVCNQLLADKMENFYVYYVSGMTAYQVKDWVLAQQHFQKALSLSHGGTAERIADVTSRLQSLTTR